MNWRGGLIDGFTGCKVYFSGPLTVLLADPETTEYKSTQRWHLSISHPHRYPKWDEIKSARYSLIPNEITMVMYLPPAEEYVNVHKNCFHLHESKENLEGIIIPS